MPTDMKNLVNRVRKLQKTLETKLDESALVQDLKKYAESQQKVLRKKMNSNDDVKRVISYLEKRRKDLDKVTKNLPKEVATMRKYVAAQKKEFEKIGKQLIQELANGNIKGAKKVARAATKKYAGSAKKGRARAANL